MITKQNLSKHELIGLQVKVTDAKNKDNIGVSGKIIDETQKTLVIRNDEIKSIMKDGTAFQITLPNKQKETLEGDKIAFRPWERVSK